MVSSNLAQESSTSSSPGVPKVPPKKPTKRIRISTACINCRHKKIKCDGQAPCIHCEKFHTECIYPIATKPANQEYVETLENRLKSVESHLQGLLSRGYGAKGEAGDLEPDDVEAYSPYTPSSIPSTPPSKPSHSINDSNSSHSSQRHAQHMPLPRQFSGATIGTKLTGLDSESEETTFASDESMQFLGLLMGSLKIERGGTALYLSKAQEHKERSYHDSRAYDSSSSSGFPDFSALDWESTEVPPPYTLPKTLLSPKAINALLDIYFNSVHTFLPVIHKTSFLTLCQEGEYRVPPFLLMAICAVAARHATDFELQEIPELSNLKSHHALYDQARALLDNFMDVPRLSTIQGLLLIAYYQTKEKRSGHFFRIRMYLSLATRMALDMGLQRALIKGRNEVESSSTADSLSSVGNASNRSFIGNNSTSYMSNNMHGRQSGTHSELHSQNRDQLQSRGLQEKQAVILQESCLAWLGCFFLDGLTSSLMGQEYCISSATTLDMPKLIQDASEMTDTVQGATLIFWYHHLELVQIYRRICLFYRAIPNERVLAKTIQGLDMQAIESSMDDWLSKLPAHLVYVDNQEPGAALPSYYTLYLHRFFYSHKLLLYRPLISSKIHRGELKDSNSALARCSHAATMLTQIGEIIFQNYSWPWPGCGLFAYHMLQAAEIHVFQMVTQSAVDSQSLYYRTMDLLKGYVSLAKLPELEKDIVAMEEMVNNFLLTPQEPVAPSHHHQQQQQQQLRQHQHFVATPASDYSYASVMSPASPAESVQRMTMTHGGHSGSGTEDTDMFSPLQTHAYPSFEAAGRTFRPQQQQQNNNAAIKNVSAAASAAVASGFMADTNGFSMGFDLPSVSPAAQGAGSSQAGLYSSSNALPFYTSTTTSGTSMSMFDSNNHGNSLPYGQHSFLQAPLTPVGDLLGMGSMDNRGFTSQQHQHNGNSDLPASRPAAALSPTLPTSASGPSEPKKKALPPPKPPKRILSQSTGSSSSSGISQSLKPPVPKKPTRLADAPLSAGSTGSAPRWIAPRPESMVVPAVTLVTPTSGPEAYYGGKPSMGGSNANNSSTSNGFGSGANDAFSGAGAPNSGGASGGRTIKMLQPQMPLYGMGTLVNSLGVEQQVHQILELENDEDHEQAFQYLQINPHLYEPVPPNMRQLI
ncbi:hypothetical protein BGZ98_007267 [Dissophora globulifera]|nr:hypothetical protein BGZ98_007267 [Dissophora globulifera]